MMMTTKAVPFRRALSEDCDKNHFYMYDHTDQTMTKKSLLQPVEGVAKRKFSNESCSISNSPVKRTPSSPIPCPKPNSRDEEAEAEAYLEDFYTRSTWIMYHRIKNARMAQARTTS
jgi:hypothetical protein